MLQALQQLREAEGKPPPDEPATLRELAQPGDTPKLSAYLNGETQLAMAAHFAAELDTHSREAYARLLTGVACYGDTVLTEIQSTLLLELLQTLWLPDIRTNLLAQVRKMEMEDLKECLRIVRQHDLKVNIYFDSLMLIRSGGSFDINKINLLAELGAATDLNKGAAIGLPVLAGYLLGLHERSDYTSPEIIQLEAWDSLLLKPMSRSDISNGKIKGYYVVNKDITIEKTTIEDLKIIDAYIYFYGGSINFIKSPNNKTTIINTTFTGLSGTSKPSQFSFTENAYNLYFRGRELFGKKNAITIFTKNTSISANAEIPPSKHQKQTKKIPSSHKKPKPPFIFWPFSKNS